MKRKLIIVGAGLGGCFLADSLADSFDITLIELGNEPPLLQERVIDMAMPAATNPHICSGLGGTTSAWHNGLIEISDEVFSEKWPFRKSELDPYYAQAYPKLAGIPQNSANAAIETLRRKFLNMGFLATDLGSGLFYPRRRINVWDSLRLAGRVRVIQGEVTSLRSDEKQVIQHLMIKNSHGEHMISGDVFVLAAGGLGTPLLLKELAEHLPLNALQQAGLNYEDHPSAFVGEVTLDVPVYKLWNYSAPGTGGNLRLPLVVKQDGLEISFQLRPAAIYNRNSSSREKVVSVLTELRNDPYNPRTYFRLVSQWDDILDILSFKFRIQLPTRHYSLLMVAEQPSSAFRAVWRNNGAKFIYRKWEIDENYISTLQKSIRQLITNLGGKVKNSTVFPSWPKNLFSSSHHSGTARMALSPEEGVCDLNGRVFGLENLYVCDGSLIPASGYANTGLTIAALALRMTNHFRNKYS
jgi:hypothetical protein